MKILKTAHPQPPQTARQAAGEAFFGFSACFSDMKWAVPLVNKARGAPVFFPFSIALETLPGRYTWGAVDAQGHAGGAANDTGVKLDFDAFAHTV